MANSLDISHRILESALARKLAPGSRLGEQPLATVFGCSRTIVREALFRLAARGVVTVSARRGWFVIEPTREDAQQAFEARRVVETGLIRAMGPLDASGLKRLRGHVQRQNAAIESGDTGLRSFLLGDFHVCLAECLGNRLLCETVRDLTVRTTLAAMHHQSDGDAAQSCAEHREIIAALAAGETAQAERLMAAHLESWQAKLRLPAASDPISHLRHALQPLPAAAPQTQARTTPSKTPRASTPKEKPPKAKTTGRQSRPPRASLSQET